MSRARGNVLRMTRPRCTAALSSFCLASIVWFEPSFVRLMKHTAFSPAT